MAYYYAKLVYNAQGGSGAPSNTVGMSTTAGASITLRVASATPTKTYYTFNGWALTSGATSGMSAGTALSVNVSTTAGSDNARSYTLYAAWAHQTAYVYYNANGGSGAPSTQSHWAGYSVTLSSTEPTRSGYIFLGWATTADATTASYDAGGTYALYSTTTLYAVWKVAADSISASDGTLGTALAITITKNDESYTDTLTYTFGSATGTIISDTTATSVTWTPPTSLASEIPNASSGTCVITCSTYEDGTLLGTSTITITLSVPQSLAPTVSVSISDTNTTASGWGLYVQSRSKLAFTITASGQESATITAYSTTVNGSSYSSASFTTGVLLYSGSNTYTVNVTDSRGLTQTVTATFNVQAYAVPSLTLTICDRDDSDVEQVNVEFTYSVSSVNNNNAKKYAVDYKLKSASSWTSGTQTTLSSYSGTQTATLTGLDGGDEYDIRVRLIDSFGTSSVLSEVGASTNLILNSRHLGGIGIGMKSQADNQIDMGKPVVFHDTITIGSTTLTEAQLISLLNLI